MDGWDFQPSLPAGKLARFLIHMNVSVFKKNGPVRIPPPDASLLVCPNDADMQLNICSSIAPGILREEFPGWHGRLGLSAFTIGW